MKIIKIFAACTITLAALLSGCAHQQNRSTNMTDKNPVQEAANLKVTTKTKYSTDDSIVEYRDFFYNKNNQPIQEILYNKKGKIKEICSFEYTSGNLTKQVVKNKKNNVKETREYMYTDNVLVIKNIKNIDNKSTKVHTYEYNEGLLKKETVVEYMENGIVTGEYYYTFFYDNLHLVKREQYNKGESTDILTETRNYFYATSKLIKEEKLDARRNLVNYFVYTYGGHKDRYHYVPAMAIYKKIFSDKIFHEFIVEISREEWDGITRDMLDYAEEHPVRLLYEGDGRPYRTGNYRKATFIYKRPDGNEIILDEVGIRTRGNESRRLPEQNGRYQKTHFKIKFDETFDNDKNSLEYLRKNSRRFAGMKALNFKWSRYFSWDQYPNKSKINELFSYELLHKAGVSAPHMSLAILTFKIAGKTVDYGIYGIVEHVDKEFLAKRFGSDNDGDLYKCLYLGAGPHLTSNSIQGENVGVKNFDTNYRPIYDLKTNRKTSDHSRLAKFIQKLNSTQGEDFINYIENNFEVDKFLKFLAIGIYINNLDDYRFLANNYYLYFKTKGKIEFIPYDFDISLGTGWHGEMNYTQFIDQNIFDTTNIPAMWGDYSRRPLVDKILAVQKYKEKYIDYLKEYIDPDNNMFLFSKYKEKFDQLHALYNGKDINNTADNDSMALHGFEADYFYDKTKNVLDQLGIPYKGYEVGE